MSGGYFEYGQYNIEAIAETITDIIYHNDDETLDDYGQKRGYFFTPETIAKFTEAVKILKRAQVYAQRIDYLMSGDDGEDSFHKRLDKELKQLDK